MNLLRVRAPVCALAGIVLGLAGCASSPPSTFYTLTALEDASRAADLQGGSLAVELGPVSFPEFLDRPQIVARDGANQLALDEFHRWGGTLSDDFLRVWSENLSQLLATSRIRTVPGEVRFPVDFRVVATVLGFEGTSDGQALLKVRWMVLDPYTDRVLAVHEGRYREPVSDPADKAALAAAMSRTLAAFSRDVAATLGSLPKPRRPRDPLAG